MPVNRLIASGSPNTRSPSRLRSMAPAGPSISRSECHGEGLPCRPPGLVDFVTENVGVENRCTKFRELLRDGGLAAGDAPGEPDYEHCHHQILHAKSTIAVREGSNRRGSTGSAGVLPAPAVDRRHRGRVSNPPASPHME